MFNTDGPKLPPNDPVWTWVGYCPSCAEKEKEIQRLLDSGMGLGRGDAIEENARMKEAIDEMEKAYPPDIFTEPGPDDFAHLRIGPRGISERLHGSWARHLVEVIRRRAKEG